MPEGVKRNFECALKFQLRRVIPLPYETIWQMAVCLNLASLDREILQMKI